MSRIASAYMFVRVFKLVFATEPDIVGNDRIYVAVLLTLVAIVEVLYISNQAGIQFLIGYMIFLHHAHVQ
jgi:hypothetical protein